MGESKLRIHEPAPGGPTPVANKATGTGPPPRNVQTVTVRAGQVLPVLADALAAGRTWLKDFEDDEVTIPFDLYEVILAYQHYQRLSA